MYFLGLVRSRKDASVMTSSIAALYCLYLQWSALSSDPDKTCNSNLDSYSNVVLQICVGLAFTMTVFIIISSSTNKNEEGNATFGGSIIEDEEKNLSFKVDYVRVKGDKKKRRSDSSSDSSDFFDMSHKDISGATIIF